MLTSFSLLKNLKLQFFFARNDIGCPIFSQKKYFVDTLLTKIEEKAIYKYIDNVLKYYMESPKCFNPLVRIFGCSMVQYGVHRRFLHNMDIEKTGK